MDEFKYCRVCLVMDVKMYSLEAKSGDSIGAVYSNLSQIPVTDSNQHACFECASLLKKFQEFKSKCLRAHNIISTIKVNSAEITRQTIKDVDRKINKLESSLAQSPVAVCDEPGSYVKIEVIKNEDKGSKPLELELNIKIEETNPTEIDEKCDSNEIDDHEPLNDFKESKQTSTKVKATQLKRKPNKTVSPPKRKGRPIKEPKTKKRKILTTKKSKDNASDDEPLSKSVTKTKPVDKNKRNGVDIRYFEDYATVVFLSPGDARKEVLLRKESSNYKKSTFKCDLCYRGYDTTATFDNHMRKHTTVFGEHECEFCYLRFPQNGHLYKHRLACHKTKFSCKLCPYISYNVYQAKTHVSLHKGKKYPCKDCDEVFSMPNSLQMHKRMKHLKEAVRECVCEFCGDTFGTPRGLFLHNMKVHRQDKNDKLGPECKECGIHFTSDVAWKRHLVLSTKHKVSNGCKVCGDTFETEDELKTHTRVHARKYRSRVIKVPTSCPVCDKWLTTRAEYKAHVTSEHPHSSDAKKLKAEDLTPFVCEVCGQMFRQQCFLNYHQRKHTGERPFKCDVCGKGFQLSGTLSIHRAIHDPKTFKCDMCGRVFGFKSALNKHMKAHLNIRPHKCAICDKGFIHMCDLKLHIKYVHDKIPWPKKKNKRNTDDTSYMDYN